MHVKRFLCAKERVSCIVRHDSLVQKEVYIQVSLSAIPAFEARSSIPTCFTSYQEQHIFPFTIIFTLYILRDKMASFQELETRITDLEEATWRALQKSGEAMVPFITEDCIMQFPMGMKLTRDSDPSVLDVLHSPAFVPWKSFEMLSIDVTPIGREGAVISYLVQATRPPQQEGDRDTQFDALCSSVWRWDGEKYALCFHQQTLATS